MPILINFRHSMHLLGFCRRKEPETLPGRDTTFVRCQEWLTCCMGAYIGHPHMVPKFGVISCRPAHSTCAITIIRVCRRGSPKDVVFLDSTKWAQIFSHNGMTMDIMHANSHRFPTLDAFTRILPAKRTRNAART